MGGMEWPDLSPHRSEASALAELLAVLRDARFRDGLCCPRCGHRRIHRWGSASGRQRYRCLGCRRTFNDLTGTPAAYLKKLSLLPAYARCLHAALSVRRSAAQLDLAPSTTFRWRHRLLDALRARDREPLTGWIELDSFRLPLSFKGQRLPDHHRPPRRRGLPRSHRYEVPHVQILVACDRHGHLVSALARQPPARIPGLRTRALEVALAPRLRGCPHLLPARSLFAPAFRFARRTRLALHDPRRQRVGPDAFTLPSRHATSLVHTRTAWAYIRRFRRWLAPFRGVATSYLPNYLLWHRHVDAAQRRGFEALSLTWPLAS